MSLLRSRLPESDTVTDLIEGRAPALAVKAMTPVVGMCVGADSIEDVDVLRTGGTHRLFGGIYVRPARR
jgi:hypothetical protein